MIVKQASINDIPVNAEMIDKDQDEHDDMPF